MRDIMKDLDVPVSRKSTKEVTHDVVEALVLRRAEALETRPTKQQWCSALSPPSSLFCRQAVPSIAAWWVSSLELLPFAAPTPPLGHASPPSCSSATRDI